MATLALLESGSRPSKVSIPAYPLGWQRKATLLVPDEDSLNTCLPPRMAKEGNKALARKGLLAREEGSQYLPTPRGRATPPEDAVVVSIPAYLFGGWQRDHLGGNEGPGVPSSPYLLTSYDEKAREGKDQRCVSRISIPADPEEEKEDGKDDMACPWFLNTCLPPRMGTPGSTASVSIPAYP